MAYRELYTASFMAGEQYNISDGSLALNPAQIRFYVDPRGIREGNFVVSAAPGTRLCGVVIPDNLHMSVARNEITSNPDRISWRFDAGALTQGETVEGAFSLITNCGEYQIPFTAMVRESEKSADSGENRTSARTNAAAARLYAQADRDWGSAVQLFYRREFAASLHTDKEKLLYRGLSVSPGNEQNVEEFLAAACGKAPVEFETDHSLIRMETYALGQGLTIAAKGENRNLHFMLTIRKKGWGYTHLEIRASGSFLTPAAAVIEAGDFIGDECTFPLVIDKTGLHAGRNYGRLYLISPYRQTEIPVEVLCHDKRRSGMRRRSDFARVAAQLIRHYEILHLSFIREDQGQGKEPGVDSGEWLRRGYELVQRMQMADRESCVPGLYRAQLLMMENRIHQAILELEGVRRKLAGVGTDEVLEMGYAQYPGETQAEYCYRQFLTALAYNDADEITPRVGRILRERYRKTPADWRIAWMMIQIIPEYAKGTPARWNFLKKQFTNGSRSPIIYLEAFELMEAEPSLMDLGQDRMTGRYAGDAFERQVIYYAIRKNIMDPDTMRHVLSRIDRRRGFSAFIYRILCAAYESERLSSIRTMILESICRLLIRGSKAGAEYFAWFSRAVDKKLQITRLADFFLQSMPEDYHGEIPEPVMEGAARSTAVSGDNRIYLYRYLYENRQRWRSIYEHYREEIRSCLEQQIREHRMTENLAALYKASLQDEAIAPPNIGDLTKLSFYAHLRTTRMNVRQAAVVYENSSGESLYRVSGGNAIFPVYGDRNCIFLEDDKHNRYAAGIPYTCDRMMEPVTRPDLVSAEEMDDLPFALQIAGADADSFTVTRETAGYCALLIRSDRIASSYRTKLAEKLLLYYASSGQPARMDSVWNAVDLMDLTGEERTQLLTLMHGHGQNTRAARWLLSQGAEHCSAELIGKIALSAAEESAEGGGQLTGRQLAGLFMEAYRRGFREEAVIRTLVMDADADTEDLTVLWREIEQQQLKQLCGERILKQILFSGQCIQDTADIMTQIYACGDGGNKPVSGEGAVSEEQTGQKRQNMEIVMCAAAQYCHYTFAHWRDMDSAVMDLIMKIHSDGHAQAPIVQLAFLQALLEKPDGFGEEEAQTASSFMTSLLREGIVFPFYRKFSGAGPALRLYDRETMLEYHAPAGLRAAQGHIVIHYSIERGGGQEPFVSRDMKEMVRGFYVSSFFLFGGEQMHYFITDDPGEKNIVESGTIGRDLPAVAVTDDRFGLIDAISRSVANKDREETLRLMTQYRQKEYLTAALFEESAK